MNNHYGLEVLVNEHQYELRQNADNYRLLQEGRTTSPVVPALLQRMAALYHGVTGRLACQLSGWRYRMLVRLGAEPTAEACS